MQRCAADVGGNCESRFWSERDSLVSLCRDYTHHKTHRVNSRILSQGLHRSVGGSGLRPVWLTCGAVGAQISRSAVNPFQRVLQSSGSKVQARLRKASCQQELVVLSVDLEWAGEQRSGNATALIFTAAQLGPDRPATDRTLKPLTISTKLCNLRERL